MPDNKEKVTNKAELAADLQRRLRRKPKEFDLVKSLLNLPENLSRLNIAIEFKEGSYVISERLTLSNLFTEKMEPLKIDQRKIDQLVTDPVIQEKKFNAASKKTETPNNSVMAKNFKARLKENKNEFEVVKNILNLPKNLARENIKIEFKDGNFVISEKLSASNLFAKKMAPKVIQKSQIETLLKDPAFDQSMPKDAPNKQESSENNKKNPSLTQNYASSKELDLNQPVSPGYVSAKELNNAVSPGYVSANELNNPVSPGYYSSGDLFNKEKGLLHSEQAQRASAGPDKNRSNKDPVHNADKTNETKRRNTI